MHLDPTTCLRALRARHRRCAGRFLVGVRTTGVSCRPVCPARTPLRGIGEWTAQYIAMRGLGEPDAHPCGDLVLRQALGGISAAELARAAEARRPWRACGAVHLWAGGNHREHRGAQGRTA